MTHELAPSAGTIEYEDSGGVGPAVVLLPGLMMDASLWAEVIAQLPASYRCLAPTLPLGAHRVAVKEEADLSPRGIAGLVEELIERLDLDDVTLVGNDTGGAIAQLVAAGAAARIGGIVLVSCDAFDNFPPGLTGKTLVMSGKLPPALFGAFMQQLRLRFVRRLPISFGWLTKRGDAVVRECLAPVLSQREIRRDTVRLLRALAAEKDVLLEAAELLPAFDRPALVVWASEDRVMPPEHGHRLGQILPAGRVAEIDDSYTLIPLDQPGQLAQLIKDFVDGAVGTRSGEHHVEPAAEAAVSS